MESRAKLGEVLRGLRKSRALSLRDAAARAELSASFIRLVELGQTGISAHRLARLAGVYGLDAPDLIRLASAGGPLPDVEDASDDRRRAVVLTALDSLGREDFDPTRLGEDHELLLEAYAVASQITLGEIQRAWRGAVDAWDQLDGLLSVLAPIGDGADIVLRVWLQLLVQSSGSPVVADAQREIYRRTVALYRTVVETGQREGVMRADVDATVIAWQLAGLVDGLALQVVAQSPDLDAPRIKSMALDLARARLAL